MAKRILTLPCVSLLRHSPVSRSTYRQFQSAPHERQELFNKIAPVYDKMNEWFFLGRHKMWQKMSVSWSEVKEGNTVLDVCCGSGDLAFLLSEKVGIKGKVIALDFSKELLVVAESRQQEKTNPCYKNIEWVLGDAIDLPFSDSSFDAATLSYGLRNIVDRHKGMQEMCRVLKPGSKVSILDFNKSTHPLVTAIQNWVIDDLVVPVARGYGLENEYQYLKNSIKEFHTGDELEKLALEAGFSAAEHFELEAGLMGNLVARK